MIWIIPLFLLWNIFFTHYQVYPPSTALFLPSGCSEIETSDTCKILHKKKGPLIDYEPFHFFTSLILYQNIWLYGKPTDRGNKIGNMWVDSRGGRTLKRHCCQKGGFRKTHNDLNARKLNVILILPSQWSLLLARCLNLFPTAESIQSHNHERRKTTLSL